MSARTLLAALTLVVTASAPAGAVTRDEVIDLARDYCYHEWYCSADNLVVDCSNSWSSDYSVGWWIGLPYDWGGYYTLPEYDAALAAGEGAGSHSWHGILSCTTGVDCSGFVSEAFQTTHQSTSTFYTVTHEIASASLTRADALNDAGSHIVLFTHETDAGRPVFYEASGSASKVRLNSSSSWGYLGSYEPIRYDGITDGTAHGTVDHPIDITSFPYETFDATAGVGSDAFDSYSCAPSTDESGPERIYRVQLATAGELTVTVTDDADTDVDIHLLSGPDPGDCLARDDLSFTHPLAAGTYWITADTYCSAGGSEYPGGYFLHVAFEPGGGDDDDTPGDDDDTAGDDDDTPGDDDDTVGDDDSTAGDDDDGIGPFASLPPPRVGAGYDEGGCSCSVRAGAGARGGRGAAAVALLLLAITRRRPGRRTPARRSCP